MNNLTLKNKQDRARKMMLLLSLLSITMTFGGLTSAYVVSKGRPDWLIDFQLPNLFFYSTFIIILSSFTIQVSYYYLKTNQSKNKVITWLLTSFLLGLIFCFLQFYSFKSLIEMGYFFAGAQSTITTSFIYVLTFLHGLHLLAGLIDLTVLIHNTIKNK